MREFGGDLVFFLSKSIARTKLILARVWVRLFLFEGKKIPSDQNWGLLLVAELPNVVMDHLVELHGWTHIDYTIAMDADIYVYNYVLNLFAQY